MNFRVFFQLYFRSLLRNKFQSLVQILGLSVGISVAILVFLFLQDELSYDRFHNNYRNIYKYGIEMQIGEAAPSRQFSCSPPAGPLLKNYMPEIKQFTRTHFVGEVVVKLENSQVFESEFRWMDSTGLEMFNFPILSGDPETALDEPYSIVLTEELAQKYFASESPVGKVMDLGDLGLFSVTAVVEDPPENSDINFTALLSYHTQYADNPEQISPNLLFGGMGTHLYFLVNDGFEQADFDKKLKLFYDEYMAEVDRINYVSIVEPIARIRLKSSIATISASRNRGFFAGFLTIGLIVLILSVINYANLSTAGFLSRSKEVSVKKTLGLERSKLTLQFLAESGVNTFIALLLGLSIAEIILSFTQLNTLLNKDLSLSFSGNSGLLAGIAVVFLFTAVLSGIYPAIFMARTSPLHYMRGDNSGGSRSGKIRSLLVGFQFILSTTAIIMILLMNKQINYVSNMDLGFDKSNLLVMETRTDQIKNGAEAFRQDILSHASISSAGFCNTAPGYGINGNAFTWENNIGEMELHAFLTLVADRQFPKALGIKIIQGSDFEDYESSDSSRYFIVNQAMVEYMEWDNPVGMRNQYGEVVGVMKDINMQTARAEIRPTFMLLDNNPNQFLVTRIEEGSSQEAIEYIKSTWKKHFRDIPLEYNFLEDVLLSSYGREKTQQKLFVFLVLICILLSGLGLLGITAHLLTKRTKEVAIRKVFGASVFQVIYPLVRPLIIILSSAMVLSIPIVIIFYEKWLVNYVYRKSADPIIFILVFLGIFLFATLISTYHGIQVARTRPVEKIKYE